MKKKITLITICLFWSVISIGCHKNDDKKGDNNSNHPQILLLEGEEQIIKDLIATDATWQKIHFAILEECNKIIGKPPVERVLIGRRLLDKSRECLRRVFFLSYAYRMTGDERFFKRAEQEMLAVSGFSDWNPSHFLDVAEMTMGIAIGYDWLYTGLSKTSRNTILEAIVNKGINPSYDKTYNSFLTATTNWNQVCNAGMTYGALAIRDEYAELAKKTIDRAFSTIHLPMEDYQPDGAYPEGYGYWGYGTSFNVMFLSAVEKALGTDNGLTETPGFLKTAEYLKNILAPGGQCFNYSDCGSGGSLNPAMFWLAERNADPSLLWSENKFLQVDDFSKFTGNRLLPAIMIWGKNIPLKQINEPDSKVWIGQGKNPVSIMRTSWTDSKAIYAGLKAGSPSVNHGHMDVGTFVMEADGVRWASDPGMQNYESLESLGMSIFGKTQDAQRWTIFRMNNLSHNVLTIDDEHQKVDGYARIDRYSEDENFPFAISEITTVYNNQLKKAVRGIGIIDKKYVVVRDEIESLNKTTKIRWAMFTFANVVLGNNEAILTRDGKTLYLKVKGPGNIIMKEWSTAPTNNYDAANPGTILVGFEFELQPNSVQSLEVLLVPQNENASADFVNKSLSDW